MSGVLCSASLVIRTSWIFALGLILSAPLVFSKVTTSLSVSISSLGEIASDKVAWLYPTSFSSGASDVLLVGNDGAATGGFNTWEVALASNGTLPNPTVHKTGRTKLVNVVYSNAAGKTGLLPSPNPTLTCDFSM